MSVFAPIAELLPHEGEMVLLSEVLEHAGDKTVCRAVISGEGIFANADGSTGAWFGLELMAQCIATDSGLIGQRDGKPPRIGLLVSSRRLRFATTRYHAGQALRIQSQHIWGSEAGMVSFDCTIHDEESDELLAEGRLNCFLPKDESELEMMLKAGKRS